MFSLKIEYETRHGFLNIRKRWFLNRRLHRKNNKPAQTTSTSPLISPYLKEWYYEGERHRYDGPAVEHRNGGREWWIFGAKFFIKETEYCTTITNKSKVLCSIFGKPSVVWNNGTKEWHYFGELHKEDSPAVIYPNGDYEHWQHGKRHKLDGPAVVIGNKQYFFEYGEFIKCIV